MRRSDSDLSGKKMPTGIIGLSAKLYSVLSFNLLGIYIGNPSGRKTEGKRNRKEN